MIHCTACIGPPRETHTSLDHEGVVSGFIRFPKILWSSLSRSYELLVKGLYFNEGIGFMWQTELAFRKKHGRRFLKMLQPMVARTTCDCIAVGPRSRADFLKLNRLRFRVWACRHAVSRKGPQRRKAQCLAV